MAANSAQLPVFTIRNAMIAYGMDDVQLFNGETQAQRFSTEVFDNDFTACMDKTFKELDDDFKSYSTLTVANGQVRLSSGTKRNIKAFIQWTRDRYCLGEDPVNIAYPVANAATHITRYKHHHAFVNKLKTLSDSATPEQFTDKTRWPNWYPTFINFFRAIPGRNGAPLSYVCRPPTVTPPAQYNHFIDKYIDRAPLTGQTFKTDAAEVHTYIIKFTTGNATAEAKMILHASNNNR